MKKFWKWRNQAQTETAPAERTLYLNGTIAEESWFDDDVTPQLFKEELMAGDGNITVEFMNDESHLPDRLKRAWGGIAGADINMAVYPVRPEQEETLLDLAQAEAAERGAAFDRESYRRGARALLAEHPNYIALSYLKGEVSGFVRMGTDKDLPASCGVIDTMYVKPALQGRGYSEQLFGYAAHELRYVDMTHIAVRCGCSAEEQRVVDRFVFEKMKGHPAYQCLYLFCPPCPYPILA